MSLERKTENTNIVRLEQRLETTVSGIVERAVRLRRVPAYEFVSGIVDCLETLLAALSAGEHLTLRLPLGSPRQPAIGLTLTAPNRRALNARKREFGSALDTVLPLAFPVLTALPRTHTGPCRYVVDLHPAGHILSAAHIPRLAPRLQPAALRGPDENRPTGVHVALDPGWRPNLDALARLRESPDLKGAVLELALSRFKPDAAFSRTLENLTATLMESFWRGERDPLARAWLHRASAVLAQWLDAGQCLRLRVQLGSARPVPALLRDLICKTVYGAAALDGPPPGVLDLADTLPGCDLRFLQDLPLFLARQARTGTPRRMTDAKRGDLFLGRREDGKPLLLDALSRTQHMFVLGETGTGKSTFIRWLVEQDIANGEAVVLFDPHGDLYHQVRECIPAARRDDVVLVHPTDPSGTFTLNILESLGQDPAVERARTVDDLIDLFKKMYKGIPAAFGPMWEKYFRNSIYLLLNVHGQDASLLDLQKVFADEDYLDNLIARCTDSHLVAFWERIARRVYHDGENPSLSNIAPYILAKLAHFSDNPVMARILAPGRSSLDFRAIVAGKKICLVNLAQPDLGSANAQFLGGLIFSRLSATLKMQAHLRPEERIPLNVYLDEYHTYASDNLAESMAQMRKFGLRYVLANQHLGQVDGGGLRPDVGQAVLGNTANKIVFRIGLVDAHFLAPWFAPHVSPIDLINLPNFHAAARILDNNAPQPPVMFRTEAPKTVRSGRS